MTKLFRRVLLLALIICLQGGLRAGAVTADAFVQSSWPMSQGAPADIWSIAQSKDGFLWLGTGSGLYRFDGVQFETPRLGNGKAFPVGNITALLLTHDGATWVGYFTGGVARLRDGQLTSYRLPGANPSSWVGSLAETYDRTVWAATADGLFHYENGSWQLIDEKAGMDGRPVSSLFVDPDGTLWVSGARHLHFLRRGERHFQTTNIPVRVFTAISRSPDGTLWLSDRWSGLRALPGVTVDHPLGDPTLPPPRKEWLIADRLLFDRHGRMWGTDIVHKYLFTIDHPAAHETGSPLRTGDVTRRFDSGDGLTSDRMSPLFEDAEGTVWVGSNLGIDSFREAAIAPVAGISRKQAPDALLAAAPDGSVWTLASSSLMRVIDGVAHPVALGPSSNYLVRLAPASSDEAWILTPQGLLHYAHRHSTLISLPTELPGYQGSLAVDRHNGLWVVVGGVGLMHWANGRFDLPVQAAPWATVITTLKVSSENLLWAVDMSGKITELSSEGKEVAQFNIRGLGHIWSLDTGTPCPVFGGDLGLGILDHGKIASVSALGDLPLFGVTGIASRDNVIWLNTGRGIVRIGWQELMNAANDPSYRPIYRLFDSHDGLRGVAQQFASKTLGFDDAGRVWAKTNQGPVIIDSTRIVKNLAEPKVFVRSIVTDEKTYTPTNGIKLAAGTSRVQFQFTSTSLAVPSRVRFRYRLTNIDKGWRDAGALRETYYTNLVPGHYVFSVLAENEDGASSTSPASVEFDIPPTFIQSAWARTSMALGALAVVVFMARQRLVRYRKRVELQVRAKVLERERIARDLHDTLMQAVQAVMLRFSITLEALGKTDPARKSLEASLGVAQKVVNEGRDRLISLRNSTSEGASLVTSIKEIVDSQAILFGMAAVLHVKGEPKALLEPVLDDIVAAVREAVINACKHARASKVTVTLCFNVKGADITVCDDGRGFSAGDSDFAASGHFGLTGMHERVRQFGGKLGIVRGHTAGTLVTIRLPHGLFLRHRMMDRAARPESSIRTSGESPRPEADIPIWPPGQRD